MRQLQPIIVADLFPEILEELLDLVSSLSAEDWDKLTACSPWSVKDVALQWHHQQHIRDAVGKPGLKQPRFFAPVLDAFVRALPHTFRETRAANGTLVALTISGESGGQWFLLKEGELWNLYLDVSHQPHAEVIVDEDVAWRIFTRGVDKSEARDEVVIVGDQSLGLKVLDIVSIIA